MIYYNPETKQFSVITGAFQSMSRALKSTGKHSPEVVSRAKNIAKIRNLNQQATKNAQKAEQIKRQTEAYTRAKNLADKAKNDLRNVKDAAKKAGNQSTISKIGSAAAKVGKGAAIGTGVVAGGALLGAGLLARGAIRTVKRTVNGNNQDRRR